MKEKLIGLLCNSTGDCNDMLQATCKAASDGMQRCQCKKHFKLDLKNVTCIRVSRRTDYLSDVNPDKETWRVNVRVIRLWKVPVYNQSNQFKSIEMVLLDEKDTTIQATVKRSLLLKYDSELKEGKSYIMHKFVVAQNGGEYKATNHPFKINFLYSTCLKEIADSSIRERLFKFIPFEDILSQTLDDTFLIDIIGEVTSIGEIEVSNYNGKQSNRVVIQVSDQRNNTINLTLWDEFALEIKSEVALRSAPLIIILQYAKIKIWRGVATLSNCMFGSKMWLNSDMDEVAEFKQSLEAIHEGSAKVTNLTNSNQSNSTKEDFPISLKKTLEELREATEECVCVVVATVRSIETSYNWYYDACPKCRRRVKLECNKYRCEKDGNVKYVKPCYKVQLRVMDESSSASFVVFEKDATEITGKSVAQLKSELTKDGDIDNFPELLNVFVSNKYVFKVKVSEFNLKQEFSTYTILKMSSDAVLIKSLGKNTEATQVSEAEASNEDLNNHVTPSTSKTARVLDFDNLEEDSCTDAEFSTSKVSLKKIKIEKDE